MSSVVSEPRRGAVYWTAYSPPEGDIEPLDPLAFDMFAERLGNELLPGLTTRTQRGRYFGMVCAGLSITEKRARHRGALDVVRQRRQAFLPFERGWALAVTLGRYGQLKQPGPAGNLRLKHEYREFRGVNRVLAHYRSSQGRPRLRPYDYRFLAAQESQGGLGAYLVALAYGGFVDAATMTLRESGRALADAFLKDAGSRANWLVDGRLHQRGNLMRVGLELDLARLGTDEAALLVDGLFSDHRPLAETYRRLVPALAPGADARTAVAAAARRNGDYLERTSQYALDFDPFRRAALTLFARLGQKLVVKAGAAQLSELGTEVVEAASSLRALAKPVADASTPHGLEDVDSFAHSLADSRSTALTLSRLLAWHARFRNPWIVETDGRRYELRRHGSFDEPESRFHGFTVGSLLSLNDDLRSATG